MHPILFSIFDYPVYAYGVLIATAILLGYFWVLFKSKTLEYHADTYLMGVFWIITIGFIGARLLYVIYYPQSFIENPITILTERGGLVWYGGLIGGSLAGVVYVWLKKIKPMAFADLVTPPLLIGLVLGRIGCFLTGCCYGKPCKLPWAVQFPNPHQTYPHFLHPTQLYESGLAFVLLLGILGVSKLPFSQRLLDGWQFSIFLIGYGIIRFVVEMYRGDALLIGPFSASQWISLVSFGIGTLLYSLIWFRQRRLNPNRKSNLI